MNVQSNIGHNNPPSQQAQAALKDFMVEAGGWLDGQAVENEGQMQAVDTLIADLKAIEKSAKDGKEEEFRPAKERADAIAAEWNPVLKEMDAVKKGLLKLVNHFKVKLAREQEQARREAERVAEKARRAAEEAKAATDFSDIEQRRAADDLALDARVADQAAQATETVKGLRTRKVAVVTDYAAFFKWLQQNDKQAVIGWLDNEARKRMATPMDGVKVEDEKYAV